VAFPIETIEQMLSFFWVFIRISVLIFMMPLFGARGIPAVWKAGLSFVLAIMLTPVVPPPATFPQSLPEILIALVSEILLGIIAAFGVRVLFASTQLAGQMMSFQMGFSMARAIDPNTGVQSTALSQFLYLFTVLLFFAIDGHHFIIRAIASSFHEIPPNGLSFHPSISTAIVKISAHMFLVGLKIAAPIMIALFLSNLSLGIVARTVPQVNILMIGFPINIGIGLMLFGLIMSNISPFIIDLTRDIGNIMMRLFKLM
jgi:flagellar biosynthetic protein FliR